MRLKNSYMNQKKSCIPHERWNAAFLPGKIYMKLFEV